MACAMGPENILKITAFVFLIFLTSCSNFKKKERTSSVVDFNVEQSLFSQESFSSELTSVLIDHKYFKIVYNPEKRIAQYVWYELTADQLKMKSASRGDKFIPDPILKKKNIPYVVSSEYAKTGFDRGHLAPSADFSWSQEANDLTFVMSNMAPQLPKLNRDSWKRLEDQVRRWACGEGRLTIITGPILEKVLPTLKSGLIIPQKFFKVIIDETPPKKIVSFIYNQRDRGDVLAKRVVPFSSIEQETKIALSEKFNELKNDSRKPASLNEWREADCY